MMLLSSVSHTVRIHCLTFFSMKRQKSIKRAGKKKKKEKAFWINCDRAKCFCLKKHLLVCFSMSFWYATEWEINCFVWFWTFQQEIKTYKLQLFERFSLMRNSWVKKKILFPEELSVRLGFWRGKKMPWGLWHTHFSLSGMHCLLQGILSSMCSWQGSFTPSLLHCTHPC